MAEATLHLVSGDPAGHSLRDCLSAVSEGDIVLLTGNAVYLAAYPERDVILSSLPCPVRMAALATDLELRGMAQLAEPHLEVIDDHAFVWLAVTCARSISWF